MPPKGGAMPRGLAPANRDEIMERFFAVPEAGTESESQDSTQPHKPIICSVPGCGYQLNPDGSCWGCLLDVT